MAKVGGSRGSQGRPSRSGRDAGGKRAAKPGGTKGGAKPGGAKSPAKKPPAKTAVPEAAPAAIEGPFVVGAIPGATPGKWIDAWHERLPEVAFDLRTITVAEQRSALFGGELDAALVRLPIDQDGLHVIPLYDEVPVVVAAADSHLMAVDELDLADLVGEVIVVPRDDVLGLEVPGGAAASFDPPHDTEEAIAIVAAGVGVVIVPMSLARLHRRKDADYRPLRDAHPSTVALAWRTGATTAAVDAFVGIVRGRTANSSR